MTRKITLTPLFLWLTLWLGFILFTNNLVLAQDNRAAGKKTNSNPGRIIVKGNVSDANGPLSGADVLEKGGKNGVTTDASGNFELAVSGSDAILVISSISHLESLAM